MNKSKNNVVDLLHKKVQKRKRDNKLIAKYRNKTYMELGKAIAKKHKINKSSYYTIAEFNKHFKIIPKN